MEMVSVGSQVQRVVQRIKLVLARTSHMCIGEQHTRCDWYALQWIRINYVARGKEHHGRKVVLHRICQP